MKNKIKIFMATKKFVNFKDSKFYNIYIKNNLDSTNNLNNNDSDKSDNNLNNLESNLSSFIKKLKKELLIFFSRNLDFRNSEDLENKDEISPKREYREYFNNFIKRSLPKDLNEVINKYIFYDEEFIIISNSNTTITNTIKSNNNNSNNNNTTNTTDLNINNDSENTNTKNLEEEPSIYFEILKLTHPFKPSTPFNNKKTSSRFRNFKYGSDFFCMKLSTNTFYLEGVYFKMSRFLSQTEFKHFKSDKIYRLRNTNTIKDTYCDILNPDNPSNISSHMGKIFDYTEFFDDLDIFNKVKNFSEDNKKILNKLEELYNEKVENFFNYLNLNNNLHNNDLCHLNLENIINTNNININTNLEDNNTNTNDLNIIKNKKDFEKNFSSISNLITPALFQYFNPSSITFTGYGREDTDVRCLGGRKFYLKIVDPKKNININNLDLNSYKNVVDKYYKNLNINDNLNTLSNINDNKNLNYSKNINSNNNLNDSKNFKGFDLKNSLFLKFSNKLLLNKPLHKPSGHKTYSLLFITSKSFDNYNDTDYEFNNNKNNIIINSKYKRFINKKLILYQQTPLRVLHRRANEVRKRNVEILAFEKVCIIRNYTNQDTKSIINFENINEYIEGKSLDNFGFVYSVSVRTNGGAYIKEMVSGDFNRSILLSELDSSNSNNYNNNSNNDNDNLTDIKSLLSIENKRISNTIKNDLKNGNLRDARYEVCDIFKGEIIFLDVLNVEY